MKDTNQDARIHGDPDQRWPGQICWMYVLTRIINICPVCPVHDHYFCYFVWLLLLHISYLRDDVMERHSE